MYLLVCSININISPILAIPYWLFSILYSLLAIPCWLFPIGYSLLAIPGNGWRMVGSSDSERAKQDSLNNLSQIGRHKQYFQRQNSQTSSWKSWKYWSRLGSVAQANGKHNIRNWGVVASITWRMCPRCIYIYIYILGSPAALQAALILSQALEADLHGSDVPFTKT